MSLLQAATVRIRLRISDSSSKAFVLGVAAVVVVPGLAAVTLLLLGDPWFPGGDMAQAELHMRGFFAHPPLVGAAGRIVSDLGVQGSHPGPSLWVAMLPVYLLGGRTSGALMAAVMSVHAVSILLIVWLALRRGGRVLAIGTALALVLFVRSSGPDFLVEPWNPWLAILPFAVFVFLLAEVLDPTTESWRRRRHWVLAAATAVGSHCIQCHAGYTVIVAAGLAGAFIGMLVLTAPGERWRSFRLGLGTSTVMTALLWLPPFLDQIRRRPGNIEILWQHFGSPAEPTIPLTTALNELASQINLLGPWLTGPDTPDWARYPGCAAFVIAWLWAWRSCAERRSDRVLLAVLGGSTIVGAVSITRIFGPFYEYTIRWMWILVALNLSVIAVVLLRRRAHPSAVVSAGSVLLLATVVWTTISISSTVKLPGATDSRISRELQAQLRTTLDRERSYLIRFYDPYTLNATGFGLTLALERIGFDVGVEPMFAAAALPHRTRIAGDVDQVLWVVVGPAVETALLDPALELEAYYNPRSEVQQLRAEVLLADIAAGLIRTGRAELVSSLETPGAALVFVEPPLEPEVADLVRELIRMGQPVGVFSIAPGDVATSLE